MALPIAMHLEPCALSLRQVALRLSAVLGRSPELKALIGYRLQT